MVNKKPQQHLNHGPKISGVFRNLKGGGARQYILGAHFQVFKTWPNFFFTLNFSTEQFFPSKGGTWEGRCKGRLNTPLPKIVDQNMALDL